MEFCTRERAPQPGHCRLRSADKVTRDVGLVGEEKTGIGLLVMNNPSFLECAGM